jgi:biopolymer transport protein ExbD
MAPGSLRDDVHDSPMAEINTTPLVDVMLVLFVIFLVTAPMLTHTVQLDLPEQALDAQPEQKRHTLAIDAQGHLFWNNQRVTLERLENLFAELAQRKPVEPVDLRVDKQVSFALLSDVMSRAERAKLSQIGFVLEAQ